MVRYRLLLPVCNLVIDLALLAATVHAVDVYRLGLRHPWPLWQQRYDYVDRTFLQNIWGPPMPLPLQTLHLGTLPAAALTSLVAELLFANGSLSWKTSSPFDLRLVSLHLCFAIAFWHFVGRLAEGFGGFWSVRLSWYLVARLFSIPASLWMISNEGARMLLVLLFMTIWAVGTAVSAIAYGRLVWRRFKAVRSSQEISK